MYIFFISTCVSDGSDVKPMFSNKPAVNNPDCDNSYKKIKNSSYPINIIEAVANGVNNIRIQLKGANLVIVNKLILSTIYTMKKYIIIILLIALGTFGITRVFFAKDSQSSDIEALEVVEEPKDREEVVMIETDMTFSVITEEVGIGGTLMMNILSIFQIIRRIKILGSLLCMVKQKPQRE